MAEQEFTLRLRLPVRLRIYWQNRPYISLLRRHLVSKQFLQDKLNELIER